MLALALLFSAVMALALTVGALLASNTPFVVFAGDWTRFGYFLIMFAIVLVSVQAIVQPIFCVYDDRGLFCQPWLRLRCCSYTALFAKAGSFWMWVELMILLLVFYFHVQLTYKGSVTGGYWFAKYLTETLHVPNDEINFYFLYNGEVMGNIMLAALVETLVAAWLLPLIGRYLIAPCKRSQEEIDTLCRLTNPAHLPFTTSDGMRIIGAVAMWSGIFPVACFMMLLYFPIALFVARTNLLGRFEPGPPTKPLQYRFCFTLYLPVYLLLHIFFCYGIYADVQVPHPQDLGAGLLPGFGGHAFSSAPKAVHSAFCVGAVLVLCVLSPYQQTQQARREGVLTPWQIAMVSLGCAEDNDVDFGLSARVSVGVHHMTTPAFFRHEHADAADAASDGSDGSDGSGGSGGGGGSGGSGQPPHAPQVVTLPDVISASSRYQPIRGIDLLEEAE
jgi:hypothetical protein